MSRYVLELTTKTSFPRWSGRIVSFIGLLDRCRDGNGFEYYSAQPCQLLGGHCVPGGVRGRNSAGNKSTYCTARRGLLNAFWSDWFYNHIFVYALQAEVKNTTVGDM